MSIELIDGFTNDTATRYDSFSLSMVGLLSGVLDKPSGVSAASRERFKHDILNLAFSFSNSEFDIVYKNSVEIVMKAVSDVSDDMSKEFSSLNVDALISTLIETMEDFKSSLNSQTDRDARAAIKKLRDIAIRTNMLQSQRGWTPVASLIAVRESEKGVDFEFNDRSGRKWASSRYVKVLTRCHYLNLYNESYLYLLSSLGENRAKLINNDSGKIELDFQIFKTSDVEIPTYAELVEARVIHPGSGYLVSKG